MTQQNPPTQLGMLTASATGECRDQDGNLLDNEGNTVVPQHESELN